MGSRRIHVLLSVALLAIAASACTVTQGDGKPYEPSSVVPAGWAPPGSTYNSARLGEYAVAGRGAENPPPEEDPVDQRCAGMECGMDDGKLCGACDPRANLVCEEHRCAAACEHMNCGVHRGVQCGTCLPGDTCTSANVCAFWSAAADVPACVRASSSAELDGKLFVIGGQKQSGQLMRVDCFDPETGAAHTRADIPAWSTGLTGFLEGERYLLFGQDYGHLFSAYDIASDTWTPQQQFSAQAGSVTAASIDGELDLLIGSQFGPFDPSANPLQWNGTSLNWSHGGGAAYEAGDRVYVFERDSSYPVHVFDALLQSWSDGPSYPSSRSGFVPVRAGDLVYLLGGSSAQVEAFDLQTGTWVTWPWGAAPAPQNLPVAVTEQTAVEADGKLYVLGGHGPATARSDTLQVLDLATGEWTVTRMPRGRIGATAAIMDGEICLFGGADLSADVDALSYDPEDDEWAVLPPLPASAIEPAVVGADDKLYVFTNEGQAFVYDLQDQAWSTLSPPAPGNRNFAAAALGGQIYLIGGSQNLTQIYDIETGAWSSGAPMQVARSGLALATLDDEIFAFGGLDNATGAASTRVERFSPGTGQWANERVMPVGLWRHSVVELNRTFYVIGGSTGPTINNSGSIMLAYDPDANEWQQLTASAPTDFGRVHLLRHDDHIVIAGGDNDGTCEIETLILNPRPDFPEIGNALEDPEVTTPQCVSGASLYDAQSCSCYQPELISCNNQCTSSLSTQSCGRCGVVCGGDQTCTAGTCTDLPL